MALMFLKSRTLQLMQLFMFHRLLSPENRADALPFLHPVVKVSVSIGGGNHTGSPSAPPSPCFQPEVPPHTEFPSLPVRETVKTLSPGRARSCHEQETPTAKQ